MPKGALGCPKGALYTGRGIIAFAQEHLWFALLVLWLDFFLYFFTGLCVPEARIHSGFQIITQN